MRSGLKALTAGALLALSLTGCGRQALDPSSADVEHVAFAVSNACAQVYAARTSADASPDTRRDLLRKALIEPVAQHGYNVDASVRACVLFSRPPDYPADRAEALQALIEMYASNREELAELGLISPETAQLLGQSRGS